MNPRYAIHEEIDRYLNGHMAVAERRAFEEQLASNPSLRADFEAQQIAHQVIMEDALLDLKKQMQRDMNGGGSAPASSNKNYRNWLLGLGGGILCISAVYYFFSSGEKENKPAVAENKVTQQAIVKQEVAPAPIAPQNQSTGSLTTAPETTPKPSTQNAQPTLQVAPDAIPDVEKEPMPEYPFRISLPSPSENIPQAAPQNSTTDNTPAPAKEDKTDPVNSYTGNSDASPENNSSFAGSFTFQPDQEGNWTLPYKENTSGIFRVISRSGSTVYQTNFSSGTTQQWNGNDAAGTPLPGGYYIFMIEYEQGGVQKGKLTILR